MPICLPSFAGVVQPAGGFSNQYSVSFDGSDDYMSFSDADAGLNTKSSATISTWINCSNTSVNQHMFGTNNKEFSGELWGTSNVLYFEMGDNKFASLNSFRTYISQDNWHHVVYVFDGSGSTNSDRIKVYIDGNLMTLSFNGTMPTSLSITDFYISKGVYNVYFNGNQDEVALWHSALSSTQVTNIYKGEESGGSGGTNGVPGDLSTFNPVGWWRMGDNNGGTGTTITDQGSAGNNGTLTNGPTFSTDVPS